MENDRAIPPGGFCPVHGLVGLGEQVVEGKGCVGQHGAADADGDGNDVALVFERLLADGGVQALGNLLQGILRGARQEGGEFPAAITRQQVGGTQVVADAGSGFLQNDIPRLAAVMVIQSALSRMSSLEKRGRRLPETWRL